MCRLGTGGNANTKVAFENCAPFTRCVTHINNEHVDTAKNLDIIMPMYNESPANVTAADSSFLKYKSSCFTNPDATGVLRNGKISVPLKYLSNFWRSLEMTLNSCKIHLELNWTKDCVTSNIDKNTTSKITNTKLYNPIVILSTKDNEKLTK